MFGKGARVTIVIALLVAPFALLTFCFAVEVCFGLRRLEDRTTLGASSRAVIVVPAHDEEAILAQRLAALNEAARGYAGILLVADNCTDSTAEIGRRLGVDTIERFDRERRGKGFALDFARLHLQADPPDLVLIIDADCMTDAQSIERLIGHCVATGSPCQSIYLQGEAPDASPAVQLSTFAFFIKNVIRQRGLQRLAGRAHLVGTGMALPWPVFDRADLATGHIVEDLKLGQELAESGHPPQMVEGATVWSNAESERNTLSQRRRWEGGFLQHAFSVGPRLLFGCLRRVDARGTWAAIDLMIPPLALLMLLDLMAFAATGALTWATRADGWPILLLLGALLLAAIALLLAWRGGGSRFVSLGGLARVPLYLMWKLPLYIGFARQGAPKEWVRTGREDS